MKLYTDKGITIEAKRCKKPLMKDQHRGRTWDYIGKNINCEQFKFYLDTTWGRCLYFNYNDNWYSMSLYQDNVNIYDIEDLRT